MTTMTTQKHGGLDDFLNSSSKSAKGGSSNLGGWKKNKDPQHGEVTVWMPVGFMPSAFWCHPINTIIEWEERDSGEKKLIVVSRRWGCHDAHITVQTRKGPTSSASLQRWRNDDGTAEHAPQVCPNCILTDVVARLVDQGKIGFADPVFEWVGSDESKAVKILAGGIYGHFRKKDLKRQHSVEMRKAGVRLDEAFKHDLRVSMKYLFVVVDDQHPENGLMTTVESEGFGAKVKAAILAEGTKVQAQTRIDMRDEKVRGQWDPSITPYPFLWQYDDTKTDAKDKAMVIALRGTPMSDAVRDLVIDAELPELPDLDPGNCFALRAELESHCKVALPWDEIFGPAERAGLMTPPTESKGEVDEEQPKAGHAPEVRGGDASASGAGPIRIGEDHPAWKNKGFRPGPEFKGAEVHVLPPNGATDADVERVIKVFSAVAREVAEVVSCSHCSAEMTTFDPNCPACGAEYDDNGNLKTRPCKNAGCVAQVPLELGPDATVPGQPVRYLCPVCASWHEITGPEDAQEWVLVEASPPKAASPRRRRGGGTTTGPAPF
jgi:hypothetical protein